MFVGHFALGFGSKRIAPAVPLPWLLVAPNFLDVVWPVLVLGGVEVARIDPGNTAFTPLDLVHMPWSHSLVMALVWSVVLGLLYRLRHRDARGALVVGALVASHWVLDWITHRPDMALVPGNPTKLGLGLWNSIAGTLLVELALFGACVWLYHRATSPIDRAGRRGFVALVAFLLFAYFAAAFGPPPPSIQAVTASVLVLTILLVAWAHWLERHRTHA